jgi:hypothetical protein
MVKSITEAYPEEIATELYQIGSRLRILSEFSRNQAFRAKVQGKRQELFNGYDLLLEASKICEDLGQGFLEISV